MKIFHFWLAVADRAKSRCSDGLLREVLPSRNLESNHQGVALFQVSWILVLEEGPWRQFCSIITVWRDSYHTNATGRMRELIEKDAGRKKGKDIELWLIIQRKLHEWKKTDSCLTQSFGSSWEDGLAPINLYVGDVGNLVQIFPFFQP